MGISVLAYSVIGRGVFSAKHDKNTQFARNDTRAKDYDFLGARYRDNILIAKRLREIGKRYGKSGAQVAIRWVLENPHITCALTGIKNRKQVSENVGALGWSLDKNDIELIDSMISRG